MHVAKLFPALFPANEVVLVHCEFWPSMFPRGNLIALSMQS